MLKKLLVASAALLGGAALALFIVTRDEPRPDISDIAETRPPVPDAENAFAALLAVATEVARRAEADPALLATLTDATPAADRPAADIAAALAATRDLQTAWFAAVALPRSLAPAFRDADAPPYPVLNLHRLGRLATLWAEAETPTSPENALRLDLAALRAAHHVTDSYDTLLVYLTGVACSNLADAHLQRVAHDHPLSPEFARELIAGIEAARSDEASFAAILRNEIHFSLRNAPTTDPAKGLAAWRALGRPPAPPGTAWFYKPWQSARWSIEELRACLAQLDGRPVAAIGYPQPDHGSPELIFGLPHPDNAFGRYCTKFDPIQLPQLLVLRAKHAARGSALQAWLAARAWQTEHAEPPPDLDTLAPAYFPRVPTDFCDGAPIRYSAPLRAVWSVGSTGYSVDDAATLPARGEADFRLPIE